MNKLVKCPICHMEYVLVLDDDEHAKWHTAYCRKARLASKNSVSERGNEGFLYYMRHVEGDLVEMVGLGEFQFPEEEFHQETPLFLKRNSISSHKRIEWLHDMNYDGYITTNYCEGRYFYHLTYRGFECLAAWMGRDLICAPVE